MESPFNISATAEASDVKFGTQLGFAKAHNKITPTGKSGGGLRLGELQNMLGSTEIFLQRLGLATSNLGAQLGFEKDHHKITRRRKGGHRPGLGELSKIWGFPFNIYTTAEASDFKFGK